MTREELGEARGTQGDKWKRACHLVSELNLELVSAKMGKEVVDGSLVVKHSC